MVSTKSAEHYIWGDSCEGWRLLSAPELSVIQERMPPGTAEARHLHERARQFFYVLSGRLTMEIDGERYRISAGEGLEVPPGAAHQARNDSTTDAHFLVVSHPPSHGDRVPRALDAA
jgi:mannose-6-phosphate isomerase-like protein (cupin superfamily)